MLSSCDSRVPLLGWPRADKCPEAESLWDVGGGEHESEGEITRLFSPKVLAPTYHWLEKLRGEVFQREVGEKIFSAANIYLKKGPIQSVPNYFADRPSLAPTQVVHFWKALPSP